MPFWLIPAAMAAASLVSAGVGAASASSRAKKSRRQAQEFLDLAMTEKPEIFGFQPGQGQALLHALQSRALAEPATFTPTGFSPEIEEQQIGQLTKRAQKFSEKQQTALGERQAARGLFRSGIGAEQSRLASAETQEGLANAIANLQLGFQTQRSQEAMQAFKLNEAAKMAQMNALLGGVQQGNIAQRQQADIFNQLLALARGAAGGAGQAGQAATQAFGGLGSAFGQAGQTALLASMLGGSGGGGADGFSGGRGGLLS